MRTRANEWIELVGGGPKDGEVIPVVNDDDDDEIPNWTARIGMRDHLYVRLEGNLHDWMMMQAIRLKLMRRSQYLRRSRFGYVGVVKHTTNYLRAK